MNRFRELSKPALWSMTVLIAAIAAGCGGGDDDSTAAVVPNPGPGAAGTACTGAACVALGAAGTYVVLAQSGITNVPTSAISGNMGVSPIDATAVTGFSETLDTTGTFSTSAQVTGRIHAADYAAPTPANLTTAITDVNTAYADAAGRPNGALPVNPTAGTLNTADCVVAVPDVYTWTTDLAIGSDCTLTGSATDVWIFRVSGNLSQAAGTRLILAGGAQAKNIFWQVGGNVSILAGANFEGIVLAQTAVTLGTGATANGRLYSGTAVNFDGNTVVRPGT